VSELTNILEEVGVGNSLRVDVTGKRDRSDCRAWFSRTPMRRQFGRVADFGFGGNAGLILVMRSNALLSALSSLASDGT
jgi:hypothetical protein